MESKGVSPLIASVILIAFVVAIAGIASTFFTSFSKKQKGKIGEKGNLTVECSMGVLNIQTDSVSTDNTTLSITIENNGRASLSDLKLTGYNSTYANTSAASPSSIPQGSVRTVSADVVVKGLNKISVRAGNCPGVEDTITNTTGTWKTKY